MRQTPSLSVVLPHTYDRQWWKIRLLSSGSYIRQGKEYLKNLREYLLLEKEHSLTLIAHSFEPYWLSRMVLERVPLSLHVLTQFPRCAGRRSASRAGTRLDRVEPWTYHRRASGRKIQEVRKKRRGRKRCHCYMISLAGDHFLSYLQKVWLPWPIFLRISSPLIMVSKSACGSVILVDLINDWIFLDTRTPTKNNMNSETNASSSHSFILLLLLRKT